MSDTEPRYLPRRRLLAVAALGCAAWLSPPAARAQQADTASLRFTAARTRVNIAVAGASARVRVELPRADSTQSAPAVFSYLAQDCASIDSFRVSRGSDVLEVRQTDAGPWRRLTTLAPASPSQANYAVEYRVRFLEGEPKIPIILPAAPLTRGAAHDPGALVSLTFDAPSARVILPRMERTAEAGAWQGRYLALPSFIRIAGVESQGACEARIAGDSGGLPARFFTFVAVLVLWVPLYLWWVSRDPEPGTVSDA